MAAILVAITIVPPMAQLIFGLKRKPIYIRNIVNGLLICLGVVLLFSGFALLGLFILIAGLTAILNKYVSDRVDDKSAIRFNYGKNLALAAIVAFLLARTWMPLGVEQSVLLNFVFVALTGGLIIGFFMLIIRYYEPILRFLLLHKLLFLFVVGLFVFQGIRVFQRTGEEFMPNLDEGAFLLMPTSMPHAGMQVNVQNLRLLDMAVTAIPEVELVVGKAGRVESALDPAPMSMYENVIIYKPEYKTNEAGHRLRFKVDAAGNYLKDEAGELIPDPKGQYFRQWRDHIQTPDDIWKEIVQVTRLPGVTSAPKLQPIETRLVMLQTGMRAPMGIKVSGSDLKEIESFGVKLEQALRQVEGVKAEAVFADRIVGKPYLLLDIDREAASRHGLKITEIQTAIQAAIGGMKMTTTVEGRERYAVRVRYPRELRNDPSELQRIYVRTPAGTQIPLGELVHTRYEQGPQSIKSEDGFLVGYVLFDREEGYAEVEVVENAQAFLTNLIATGALELPAGMSYRFAGTYEQQLRASKRIRIVLPIALGIIFLILYFHFQSALLSLMVFSGVFVAFAGGFILIGLYGQGWFLNFDFFGQNMRDLFQVNTINLSVAVWVGFLALFGIATDDGVLVGTFLKQSFVDNNPKTISEIHDAVVDGGLRRVRPAMMTTATTILALLPVLTSTGRGSDIMLPMAIPTVGGMLLQTVTMFTVPVLFCIWKEIQLKSQ